MSGLLENIKLMVFDFDGTLVGNEGILSQKTVDYLHSLRNRGIAVSIATGRSLHRIRNSAEMIDPGMKLILMNGAWIHDLSTSQDLLSLNLNRDTAGKAIDLLRKWEYDVILQKGIPESHLFFYESLDENNYELRGRIERNYDRCTIVPDLNQLLDSDPTVLTILDTTDRVLKCREMLERENLDMRLTYSVSTFNAGYSWLEILHKDSTKGKALKFLAERLNLSNTEIMAVGDNHNDIDMLEWAGISVAVGNAEPEVKAIADIILPNNGGGVVNLRDL